ncbi:FadR family transcriptional regulator [Sporosarcina sp. BI001-red]|uniref:FadR/GntR family transcriptional regulator n=1 Tax=Sporosarcina sp. BI001-red TaxID=2282866 RepID=UPI000E25DB84|nr:GntR family transcriptional regulator [Sporosarcina sp. BI001-red]REB06554.1 FadR family transcriptional regulator [Sporosarcina sp. BI001-red]
MENSRPSSKRFLDIVSDLRTIIKEEGAVIGDKLPSERVLADRLQVGRSTIREALRSLELLGLIETRRGEGTFLADYKKHQLVEILSTFIMQNPQSFKSVDETRRIHERAAIECISNDPERRTLPVWESFLEKLKGIEPIIREELLQEIVVVSENRLSLKIWFLLKQYSRAPFHETMAEDEKEVASNLLKEMMNGNSQLAVMRYADWLDIVNGERRDEHEC